MAVNVSRFKTTDFLDRWAYLPSAISACLFLLILFGSPLAKTLVDKNIIATEKEPVKVDRIDLPASKLGALRIDVQTYVPNNHWVVYEIQLVDQNGQVIASAIDEAWRESGTWREGGESGTWSESDELGGLDIRSSQVEKLDIVIQVLESGTARGQATDLSVSFDIKVKNGVINKSDLWWGLLCNLGLTFMAMRATKISGQKVISKKIADSDPQGRATVGGKERLVRVKINTKLDENTPLTIQINLSIDNIYGKQIYKDTDIVIVSLNKNDDGLITKGTGMLESFFILEPRSLYRFKVNVEPDAPVEWTSLIVRDGSKTLKEIEVVKITPIPLSQPMQHFSLE